MGVMRTGNSRNTKGGGIRHPASNGIAVKCPNCQNQIVISSMKDEETIRCERCAYPMICYADLRKVVAVCEKPEKADQVACAANILVSLSEFMPEAGTAIGKLANGNILSISDTDRWNKLIDAYSCGDEGAREWLDIMCKSNPDLYGSKTCGNCGATRYFIKRKGNVSACVYCRSTK